MQKCFVYLELEFLLFLLLLLFVDVIVTMQQKQLFIYCLSNHKTCYHHVLIVYILAIIYNVDVADSQLITSKWLLNISQNFWQYFFFLMIIFFLTKVRVALTGADP